MAAKTLITVTVDQENKQIAAVVGQMAIREIARITITGLSGYGPHDLRMALTWYGTLLASCNTLEFAANGTDIYGDINLNTQELVDFLAGAADQTRKSATLAIWDITNESLAVNYKLQIQNNPYEEGMDDPTEVDPIGGVEYAPIENGVTNGNDHDHSGGDGAQIDHATLANRGTKSHAAIDSALDDVDTIYARKHPDNAAYQITATEIMGRCPDDGKWIVGTWRLFNGVYVLSPSVGEE